VTQTASHTTRPLPVPERLQPHHLGSLPTQVRRPAYEREAHGVGIAHIGIGAFHRAHQAVYVDDVLAREGGDWRIIGVSCRSGAVRDQLRPQESLYTLLELDDGAPQLRIIGSIADVLVVPTDPQAVHAVLSQPTTHIISLTISEKGYCHDPATGRLDAGHPDVLHDLAWPDQPRSTIGLVFRALRERQRRSTPPPTLLCCDNLPHNGATLRRVLLDFAELMDPALARWIDHEVAFPSTMVDRIVPATTPSDISMAAQALGFEDQGLVKAEPFTQWVIENRFAGRRPAFEAAGAQLVADVRPYEIAKLRLLNGSHSTLAYLGSLAGYAFAHEAVADGDFLALLRHIMQVEISPTLDPLPGFDIAAYQSALLARFANRGLRHSLWQIAMDGSQKLPQRLLEPLRLRLQRAQPIEALALAVAGWMRYATGHDELNRVYQVDDPLSAKLAAIVASGGTDAAALVGGFLSLTEVFGQDLPQQPTFRTALIRHLRSLFERGAHDTVRRFVQRH